VSPHPPKRVVVTSPWTGAARRPRSPVTRDIDEQTALGEVYMRSLVRAQLRLALLVCGTVGLLLGGLPLLFALAPEVGAIRVFGIRLPWLLLGGLSFPLFAGLAWLYVRLAERNERDFAELVERS
jgi:hypothetical protein